MKLVANDLENIWEFLQKNPVKGEAVGAETKNMDFSRWMRTFGRPSKRGCNVRGEELGCLIASDIDFIFLDYHRKWFQIVEVKTGGAEMNSFAQISIYNVLKSYLAPFGTPVEDHEYKFLGFHVLRMSGTDPSNSDWIQWDDDIVSPLELWNRLFMVDQI